MKWKVLALIIVFLGASAWLRQVDVTPEGSTDQVTHLGWPLPWLESTTTVDGENVTVGYNILWENLIIDAAVYGVVLLLIFS